MEIKDFLACAIQILARTTMPPEKVRKIIGAGKKQIHAFNLCDGSNTLTEIAKKSRINQGNLSRTITRWRKHGVVFFIGEGKEARYLQVYPLPKKDIS